MAEKDLTHLLREWPYEPGQINVRRIEGADGRPKLQIRLQLGVLQLEMEGRPDGRTPHGRESYLDYHTDRLETYVRETGSPAGFVLSQQDTADLRDETMLYYHRYVGLFVLEDFDAVIRDTTRNLEALDLCRNFGSTESDSLRLEHMRPHILTMRCRALASKAIRSSDPRAALRVIDAGLEQVQQALDELGLGDRIERSNDIQLLRGMRDALVPKLPGSQRVELEQRLREALAAENYELASILRDELRMMDA